MQILPKKTLRIPLSKEWPVVLVTLGKQEAEDKVQVFMSNCPLLKGWFVNFRQGSADCGLEVSRQSFLEW